MIRYVRSRTDCILVMSVALAAWGLLIGTIAAKF